MAQVKNARVTHTNTLEHFSMNPFRFLFSSGLPHVRFLGVLLVAMLLAESLLTEKFWGEQLRAAERTNVLLIVSEDNGPELGCYGDPYARTPHLDQLAANGVRFENAIVPYSVCSPSRACFLTGLYPHQNGQLGLATHKFAMYHAKTPNFVTLLKSQGYQTGLIGKLHVNPEAAFPFDSHDIPAANFNRKSSGADYAAAAGKFFATAEGRPWFLSVNFPDAHLPFLAQANGIPQQPLGAKDVQAMPWVGVQTERLREQVANYYNCLERLDAGVGLLLAELEKTGQAEQTLVIYIGDHGAQFPRGKGTVHEAALRIPMIVRWPNNAQAGLVREELVSTIDLLPTALTAAGAKIPANLPGGALQPLLRGAKDVPWREYNFALTTGSFPRACFVQHSVRDARFKLISSPRPGTENLDAHTYLDPSHPHFVISGATLADQMTVSPLVRAAFDRWLRPPRYELYDLEKDPSEWHNLAEDPAYKQEKQRLVTALTAWQRETRDPLMDSENLEAYVAEQAANYAMPYKTNPRFRWSYLDTFPKWRAAQE